MLVFALCLVNIVLMRRVACCVFFGNLNGDFGVHITISCDRF